MPYIATKPVSFDRRYSIGETIPDAVVDPTRASALQAMGLILEKAAVSPQEGHNDTGDVNTQADDEKGADEPADASAEAITTGTDPKAEKKTKAKVNP